MASVSNGSVPVIADVALLALALIWFALSVACAERATGSASSEPPAEPLGQEGARLPLWDWVDRPPPTDG